MAIQDSSKAVQILTDWCAKHQNLKNNEHNIRLLSSWIKTNHGVAGELILTTASLDMAFLALSSQLEFYPSAEDQQKIEQANQQAQTLLAEKQALEAEAERERKRIDAEILRESRQRARTPFSAAFQGMEEAKAQRQREATERQNAAVRAQQHAAFVSELHRANNHIVAMTDGSGRIQWGKTESARQMLREGLKRKYPEFASDIR